MGSTPTVRRLKEIHRFVSPDVLFLMETKNSDDFISDKLDWMGYSNKFTVPPLGLGGGLALLWKDTSEISIHNSFPNFIDTEVKYKGVSSSITFIYGPPQKEHRTEFWSQISELGLARNSPWLLTGDFNDILENSEKIGGPPRWEGSFRTSEILSLRMGCGILSTLGAIYHGEGLVTLTSFNQDSIGPCRIALGQKLTQQADVDISDLRDQIIDRSSLTSTQTVKKRYDFFDLIED